MSLSKLVMDTLKHVQAPPVCQTDFPSDPSRGEVRVEVADRCSCHLPTTVQVRARVCVSIDATHMADRTYVDTVDFIPKSVWKRVIVAHFTFEKF